jgi:hypothetical protein
MVMPDILPESQGALHQSTFSDVNSMKLMILPRFFARFPGRLRSCRVARRESCVSRENPQKLMRTPQFPRDPSKSRAKTSFARLLPGKIVRKPHLLARFPENL